MQSRARILLSAIAAAATLAGCTRTGADEADDALDRDQTASTTEPAEMQPATPPQTAMQPSSETPPVMPEGETDAAPQLTDEQVFAMISVMGDKEMELARLAQQRGRSKEVRAYAAMIIAHGQEAKNRRTKLAQDTAFVPARSDASQMIVVDSKADLEALKNTPPEEFDKAFVKVMADDKRAMLVFLDAMDDAVKSDALDDYIDERKDIVESDLRTTEELRSMLEEAKPEQKTPKRGPMPGPSGV